MDRFLRHLIEARRKIGAGEDLSENESIALLVAHQFGEKMAAADAARNVAERERKQTIEAMKWCASGEGDGGDWARPLDVTRRLSASQGGNSEKG
jgi:hypothetical protein